MAQEMNARAKANPCQGILAKRPICSFIVAIRQKLPRFVRRDMDVPNPCCCPTERQQYVPGAPNRSMRFNLARRGNPEVPSAASPQRKISTLSSLLFVAHWLAEFFLMDMFIVFCSL